MHVVGMVVSLTGMDGGVCFPYAHYVLVWMTLFNVLCDFSLVMSACARVQFILLFRIMRMI